MYNNDLGTDIIESDIDDMFIDKATEMHQTMLEMIADYDEDLMMKVLEGEEPTVEEIKRAIRAGVLTAEFFPVMCGSAYKNKCIQPLLDAVVDYICRHRQTFRQSRVRRKTEQSAKFILLMMNRSALWPSRLRLTRSSED